MTENVSSTVGRAAIDDYLDLVEQALMAAHAPRGDRLQVLQDLESQIAEMLAREPSPLTEESVRKVLDTLEPPSHFAATYGNGRQSSSPTPSRLPRLPRVPWAIIAAASCALSSVACLLAMFAAATNAREPVDLLIFLALLGFILTPIALWMAYRQLRAHPGTPGRDLVLMSTTVYGVLVPVLAMWLFIAITDGFILAALGFAGFVYFLYALNRRLWRYMADALPPQRASSTPGDANGHGTSLPVNQATPMPAV